MIKSLVKNILSATVRTLPPKVLTYVESEISAGKLDRILRDLPTHGVDISTVYDIGAHKGDWALSIKKSLPAADLFMFEANVSHEAHLKRTGFWYRSGILSDAVKQVAFFGEGGTGASYYKENTGLYSDIPALTQEAQTLDGVMQEADLPRPDFIKIDTQGSELDILKGATDCLGAAKLVLLECPIYPYNIGAPDMGEIVDFLLGKGLFPAASIEMHDRFGVLVQVDSVFVEKSILARMDPGFESFFMAG